MRAGHCLGGLPRLLSRPAACETAREGHEMGIAR